MFIKKVTDANALETTSVWNKKISGSVKKIEYDTKIGETEKKITNHYYNNKYITTQVNRRTF